jgi:SNF2 family DNA or RNA helicase
MNFKPHNYQAEASKFIQDNKAAGLFLDAGIGKTATTLDAISKLKAAGKINKVLLLAPLRVVHGVWIQEGAKWDNFKDLRFATLHGKDKDRILDEVDADIYLLNYDGLKWFTGRMADMDTMPFDMLVLD